MERIVLHFEVYLGIGVGGSFRSYNASVYSEQRVKLEDEDQLPEANNLSIDDVIRKIRRKFDVARQSFLKIPDSLKGMPKMNPEGIYVNKNLRLENIQVYGFD
ncbi:hypothetical protein F0562_014624 [Nyssa sinensis]|uniref:Uncharacterized protein n=1 Tax=Nyssa sinensis TaxID=561372 RepID=A0A5J4ZRM1_9ASTE|nr:hypothetical protein F0562_014624 [Nyssa sinensis]